MPPSVPVPAGRAARPVVGEPAVVTPEAVLLPLHDAGVASRALAAMTDVVARGVLVWVAALALAPVSLGLGTTAAFVLGAVATFGVLFGYPVAFEALWRGRTPGKAALGLRVVTVEGAPVRLRHAAIRAALGLVDFVLSAGVVAVTAALVTRRGQRLGDLVAGTVVVRTRDGHTIPPVAFPPPPGWDAFVAALDVRGLDGSAATLIRSFLLRAGSFEPAARDRLGADLAGRVAHRLGVGLPAGTDHTAFLAAVLAAHQRAAQPAGEAAGTSVAEPPVIDPFDEIAPGWDDPATGSLA